MRTQPCTLSHAHTEPAQPCGFTGLAQIERPLKIRLLASHHSLPPPSFPHGTGDFVEETFGPAVWAQALFKAGLSRPLPQPWVSSCPYHDRIIYR